MSHAVPSGGYSLTGCQLTSGAPDDRVEMRVDEQVVRGLGVHGRPSRAHLKCQSHQKTTGRRSTLQKQSGRRSPRGTTCHTCN
ncbi:unnamed protein product [Protopolystoma xenopodis]|uniref:Uncharacterized protein n=1 Tax=Protopolystoma xenopodis TaxID=117903 RepID=A0A3S5A4M0_9PLAT|nr:unnamed protein product [Protopolystoma xenopodis]